MTERGSVSAETLRTALALRQLIDETRGLFHKLGRAAERLHETDALSGGERAVLLELADAGPRTVPDMARRRHVSRQHIQATVNPLLERGLLELAENPRHRRSKLVRITAAGRDVARRIRSREGLVIAAVVPRLRAADLEASARTLAEIGRLLQQDAQAPGQ